MSDNNRRNGRVFKQNTAHGNITEKGPYPSQLEGMGDDSWKSRVNRSSLSLDGGSHAAYGSSNLPGTRVCRNLNKPSKAPRVEQDHVLMFKLNELKEEVGMRSLPRTEKLRERADCESARPCCSHHGSTKHLHGPSCLRKYGIGPVLYPHSCEMNIKDLAVLQNDICQTKTSISSGPFRPKTYRHCKAPSHDRFPKRFMSADQEIQIPYPCQPVSNRPACSCFNCDTHDSRAFSRPPTIPGRRGFSQNQMDPICSYDANHVSFGPLRTNHSTESFTSQLQNEESNVRQRSSMDSDTDSFDWYRQPTKRLLEPTENRKRQCHPVAGGAPFIACHKCMKLLKLPIVINWRQKNKRQKLQCGGCSIVLSVSIQNNKLRISPQGNKKQASVRNNKTISLQEEEKQASDGNSNTISLQGEEKQASDRNNDAISLQEEKKQASDGNNDTISLQEEKKQAPDRINDTISLQEEEKQASDRNNNTISLQEEKKQAPDRNNDTISLQEEKKQVSDRDQDISGNVFYKVDSNANDMSSERSVTSRVDKEESGNAYGSPNSEENVILPMVQVRNESVCTERTTGSSPSLVREEREPLEAIKAQNDVLSSDPPALPLEHEETTGQGSYSHDYLNNASSDDKIDRVGEGIRSELDEISVVDDKVSSEHRSGGNDEMLPTELHEIKSDLSQEGSNKISQEAKGKWISNGVESVLLNVVKRSFKDLSLSSPPKGRTNETAPQVFVNGQPILHHQVAKAEKLAGPISPGNYWYDWQAGFWGVIGQPCLGILPPFIEEFTYPMTGSCGAGNTSVFVNGRELHEFDLELLSSKGLPTSRGKLYIVDFYGRVVDKDSGEEVANLGKLAPTVDSRNRGFGMRVPARIL